MTIRQKKTGRKARPKTKGLKALLLQARPRFDINLPERGKLRRRPPLKFD